MKYLLIPFHLFKFWYVEAPLTLILVLKNLSLLLEEDMALRLMWRLLFVPLFHDSTIVGKMLSFFFRLTRVILGVLAITLASIIIVAIGLYWLSLPFQLFLPQILRLTPWHIFNWFIFLAGLGFFLIHIITHPHKKVWQIKNLSADRQVDFWQVSQVTKKELTLEKLLTDYEVGLLLSYLEVSREQFSNLVLPDPQTLGKLAFELAKKLGSPYISKSHFFVALISFSNIDNLLLSLGITKDDFTDALEFLEKRKKIWRRVWIWEDDFTVHHLRGVNRGWLGVQTPNLDQFSQDLTKLALSTHFDDFVGRIEKITQVINILSQGSSTNVLIVGPAGSGKTTLINYLAKSILRGDAPYALATKRLIKLELTQLISGITSQGELADRIKLIFDEVNTAGNVILVLEEIHNLGIGEVGERLNPYSLILPYLESSAFQFLATTEPESFAKILEKEPVFSRIFTKVDLPPASEKETVEILQNLAILIERKNTLSSNKIRVSFKALKRSVELASKFIHDRVLPDSAISVLKIAEPQSEGGWINAKVVEKVVSQATNIPIEVGNQQKRELLGLEGIIHQTMIDQEEAVKTVADSLRRSAAGLGEKGRPIGSFLFLGPTGVGKTELAKTLAAKYFNNKNSFYRFDMSEYQAGESVDRLIGGSDHKIGQLTEVVEHNPYCLILLDEFEKADPKTLTLFLQVLEDGRLTDVSGKTVDFRNTIIIATSNAASLLIAQSLEKGSTIDQIKSLVQDELLEVFKPELIGRFDEIVIFKPLSKDDLQKVVKIKLNALQDQLKSNGFVVNFDEELVGELVKKGFDPVLGARPLRRLIQDTIESKLSKMILENKLSKGSPFKAGVELLS